MVERGIGCLPVLTADGALSGIVTRTDILWALSSELADEDRKVPEPGPPFGYRKTLHGWPLRDALDAVRARLRDEGFGILTELSFDAVLEEKIGAELRPTIVLGACDPRRAHRAHRAEREIALLLPCHVVVFENDAGTPVVSVVEPSVLLGPRADPTLREVAIEVEGRLHRVVDGLASRPTDARRRVES
jgi:uncharacterized protein (DUF302 family)